MAGPVADYEGDSLTIHPDHMTAEEPYRVLLKGKPAIAVRHADGHLMIYALPKSKHKQ